MRPREFDELMRKKFDESEFEYNAASWEKLSERMDEKPGKRGMILWLPLAAVTSVASVAASLAMIISIPALLQHRTSSLASVKEKRTVSETVASHTIKIVPAATENVLNANTAKTIVYNTASRSNDAPTPDMVTSTQSETISAPGNTPTSIFPKAGNRTASHLTENNSKRFNFEVSEQEISKVATMFSISGGFNHGAQVNGYMISASGKKMLNDKFYVEGDIAFVNNSATAKVPLSNQAYGDHTQGALAKGMGNAYESETKKTSSVAPVPPPAATFKESSYNMFYAQMTPTIGYNVSRKLSVGMGADFQSLLQDSRPEAASTDANALQIPGLDIGLVGKTECAITSRIKAGVFYRQGLNNVIYSGNKYMDRTYIQVQLKCLVFRK